MSISLDEFAAQHMSAEEIAASDRLQEQLSAQNALLLAIAARLDAQSFNWKAADGAFEVIARAARDEGYELTLRLHRHGAPKIIIEKPSEMSSDPERGA